MTAGNQVEPVFAHDVAHELDIAWRVLVQATHRVVHIPAADEREQLRGEYLGQQHELGLVFGRGLEDVPHLVVERVPVGNGLQQILDRGDAHLHRMSPCGTSVGRLASYLGFSHTISDANPALSASSGR